MENHAALSQFPMPAIFASTFDVRYAYALGDAPLALALVSFRFLPSYFGCAMRSADVLEACVGRLLLCVEGLYLGQ